MTFPLALIVGGILVAYAGWKRQSIADVIKGVAPPPPSNAGASTGVSTGGIAGDVSSAVQGVANAVAAGASGYANPIGKGLTSGRIDQGKDWGGSGPIYAIGDAAVLSASKWNGWPGSGGVVYKLLSGPKQGQNIFVMEDVHPVVHAGQHVRAGQLIAHATGGSSGIEMGFANKEGTRPLTPYNGAADGTPMPGGKAFAAFVQSLVGRKR